jgi:hypothetical protein
MTMKLWAYLFPLVFTLAALAEEGAVAHKEEAVDPAALANAKLKSFTFDCETWPEGVPPKEVFVVDGTIRVAAKDGSKTLMVDPSPIVDATAQLGESSIGASSIQLKVLASKKGRSYPRFGISIHGMTGYRLIVNCAKKELELIKNDVVEKAVPFVWTTDNWTKLKLWVQRTESGKWLISGKAWPASETEPTDPQITHSDPSFKGSGKAAIWGTPFSETPIYFDDIAITTMGK